MNTQHKKLAAGQWQTLSFLEQMANIGSEVSRSLNWRAKKNTAYAKKAAERILELIDLTLDDSRNLQKFKELTRLREAVVDFFFCSNQFSSTEKSWRKYFDSFAYAARKPS